jgi:predicted ATP-grasp superfamily ATP-dependent carboligase
MPLGGQTHRSASSRASRDDGLACVLGEVDLVRALALGGIRSAVVAQPGNPARYSRAAVRVLEWVDPATHPEALVERLLAFGRAQSERPVLYYDGDWDLLVVSRYRSRLGQAFRFVIADEVLVETLVDKARFQTLAERLGLPVPAARRLSLFNGGGMDVELRFPVVVKPLTRRHDLWRAHAAAKALHIEDGSALASVAARLAADGIEGLVQEVIPGPESRIESYHVYVDDAGAIAGEFTGRKLRTHPRGYGYSTAVAITDSAEVTAVGREVVRALGLRGVAKLDFKRAPDGRINLLEVNPRFNLWHHPGAVAGVNLPAMVYCDLTGLPRPAAALRPGVRWCSLAHDHQAARAESLGLGRWLMWALRCEAKSGFAWRDPLPLARAAFWRIRRRLRSRPSQQHDHSPAGPPPAGGPTSAR